MPAANTPKWSELRSLGRALRAHRPNDVFLASVLKGAFLVAEDRANPIRGNLFAAAMRELLSHLLHTLAPTEEVTACQWYTPVPATTGPTRHQRATYIGQGGLSDDFIRQDLQLDPNEVYRPLIRTIESLNRLTHMRPDTVVSKGAKVKRLVRESLIGAIQLLETAVETRSQVERSLASVIDAAIMDRLISDVVDELDELSTHTRVEEHECEEITVTSIDAKAIEFAVSGQVYVELQYGSDSDVRNDIGTVMSDSYPYTGDMKSTTGAPKEIDPRSVRIRVDNSSFFE